MTLLLYILIPIIAVLAIVVLIWRRYKRISSVMKKAASAVKPVLSLEGKAAKEQDYKLLKRQVKSLFAEKFSKIETIISEMGNIYKVPCYLLIGETGAGKSTLMENSEIGFPLGPPSEAEQKQPCTFWITNNGLVIEAKGGEHNQLYMKRFYTLLLKCMKKYRRRRPFDGILYAASYETLKSHSKAPLDHQNIQYEAAFTELQRFKKATRLELPVYFIVTQCDRIPGFSSMAMALSETCRWNLMGWSNPYPLETVLEPDIYTKALDEVALHLRQIALEVLAKVDNVEDKDSIMMLDVRIKSLAPIIADYANAMMSHNVYNQDVYLRGIYFTGVKKNHQSHSLFIKDLFNEKIFKEFKLAVPNERFTIFSLERKSRFVRYAPYVLLILAPIGLWFGAHNLRQNVMSVHESLNSQMQSMLKVEAVMGDIRKWKLGDNEIQLLEYWSSRPSLFNIFLPSSWFSPLNERLHFIGSAGADVIVLLSIKISLLQKIDDLLVLPIPKLKFLTYKEYVDFLNFTFLNQFVNNAIELDMYVNLFNQLKGTSNQLAISKNDYIRLTRFALGEKASDVFVKSITRLDANLRYVRLTPIPNYTSIKNALSKKLNDIANYSSEQALQDWPLQKDAIALESSLNEVYQQKASLSTLQMIYDEIRVLNNYLSLGNGIKTHYDKKSTPWPKFDEPMKKAEIARIFDVESVMSDMEKTNAKINGILTLVQKMSNPLFGKLFNFDAINDKVNLTPEIVALEKVIQYFLDQNFVKEIPNIQVNIVGNIEWDTPALNKTLQFIDQYKKFQSILKEQKDAILQIQSDKLGQIVIDNELVNLILNSYNVTRTTYKGERIDVDELRSEAQNLQDNMSQLLKIASQAKVLGLQDSVKLLTRLLNQQSAYLLKNADRILHDDELYQPDSSGLENWDGRESLTTVLYNATGQAAIKYYLDLQRSRVLFLVDTFAKPALRIRSAFQTPGVASSPPATSTADLDAVTWKAIVDQVDAYNNKNPNSTLLSLETFIGKKLETINLSNCYAEIKIDDSSTDYFSLIENSLKLKIRNACHLIVNRDLVDGYAKLASAFNRNLAGRFPFVEPSRASDAPAAPFPAILDFFYSYGGFVKDNIALLSTIDNLTVQEKAAFDFLKRLDDSFNFLLAKNNGWYQEPRYVVEVFFRVNRTAEIDGNQIADWQFIVDDQEVRPMDKKKTLIWQYGDPLMVKLRWATNSPYLPVQIVGKPNEFVEGKVVNYDYQGSWALLRFLITHRAFNPVYVPVPYKALVKLVNLIYRDNTAGYAPKMAVYPKVVVYMGFNLTSAVDGKKLEIPNFPWLAPALYRTTPYIK